MRTLLLNNQRGGALIISLSLLGMLTLICIMAVNTAQTDTEIAYNKINTEKSFYIAEAGAKSALAELNIDPDWEEGYSDYTFSGGAFTVSIEDSTSDVSLADSVIVTSTGSYYGANSTVELTLVPDFISPFARGLFGDNMVDIRNSLETDSYNSDSGDYISTRDTLWGDVGSNGTVDVYNGAIINGSVVTSLEGGLDINAGATITGDTTDNIPPQELPAVPQSEYDSVAVINDNLTGISGTFSYNSSTDAFSSTGNVELSEGTYYFSSFTLLNSASLTIPAGDKVVIYVTGDIELKNSSEVNPGGTPADLTFYSQGDLVLKNSGEISATFYSPDGKADLRNSGEFYGAIVAEDIICHNSSKFHYDRSLSNIRRQLSDDFVIVAWREL